MTSPRSGADTGALDLASSRRAARTRVPVLPRTGSSGPQAARRRGAILRRLLALADYVAVTLALALSAVAFDGGDGSRIPWGALCVPVWLVVAKLQGLYDSDHRRVRHSTVDELPALLATGFLGGLAVAGLLGLTPAPALSAGAQFGLIGGSFALAFAARSATRWAWRASTRPETGVLVGSAAAAGAMARRLHVHPEARLRLLGYFGDPPANGESAGLPWLGPVAALRESAAEVGAERVVVTDADTTSVELSRIISACKEARLSLTLVPRHAAQLGVGVEMNRLAELPILDFRFGDPSRSTMALKRGLDAVVAASLLVVLLPAFALIALAIKLDSRGPVFFRQTRMGRGGRPFRMVKFRSMVADAEERLPDLVDLATLREPAFKLRRDPRVTRVGRLLRRFSLDELPQLWNVLRGDMSLVGPRPEERAVVELYDEQQRVRLAVRPGMTGPMQVYGRGDLSFEERLAMERDYLDNLSIMSDLGILVRTPRAILRGDGAY